jgi:hypothetical protein
LASLSSSSEQLSAAWSIIDLPFEDFFSFFFFFSLVGSKIRASSASSTTYVASVD